MESGDSSLKDWIKKSGREAFILAVRLVLVILPVVAAGILLLLLFLQNTTVHLVIFGFTATLCLGLLAGFLARLILKKSTFALRFLAAAVALFAGMVVMYLISSGILGLSPYIRTAIDWYGLVQIGLGLGAAFIALNGFRRRQVQVEDVLPDAIYAAAPASIQPFVNPPAAVTVITPVPGNRRSTAKKSKTATKKTVDKKKVVVGKNAVAKTTPAAKKSRKKVTLAAFDEHRCPYCLDEVKRNDPRGVVVCPICKAYHHKDCWDITGRCQVPHDTPL
jgi:ribosomal protein L37AE/L43A